MKPKISLISAIDVDSLTIGEESGGLPWKISEDFQYFKKTTMGHPMIMGRKTWEEFKGRPLPGRIHIVITTQRDYTVKPELTDQVFITHSIQEALKLAEEIEETEIFVIGGAQIYKEAIPYADRLYLTLVKAGINTPIKFPDYKSLGFNKIISSIKSKDDNFEYEFIVLEK